MGDDSAHCIRAAPRLMDRFFALGRGAVAQMGERCNRTAEVRGSIPLGSTSLGPDALRLKSQPGFEGIRITAHLSTPCVTRFRA